MTNPEKHESNITLREETQFIEVKYSWTRIKDDGTPERSHVWVKCRDYFNDMLTMTHEKWEGSEIVYGLPVKAGMFNPDRFDMMVKLPNEVTLLKYPTSEVFALIPTTYVETASKLLALITPDHLPPFELSLCPHRTVRVVGDKFWLSHPESVALVTYLLRYAAYEWKEDTPYEKWAKHCGSLGTYTPEQLGTLWKMFTAPWFEFPALSAEDIGDYGDKLKQVHNYRGMSVVGRVLMRPQEGWYGPSWKKELHDHFRKAYNAEV